MTKVITASRTCAAFATVIAVVALAAPSLSVTSLTGELLPRYGLGAFLAAACAQNQTAMAASLADNVTVWEADHECYGPLNKSVTLETFAGVKSKWFSIMRRPVGQMVTTPRTSTDPTGGSTFGAAFLDVGIYPQDVLNETHGEFAFAYRSVVTGSVDRDGRVTSLAMHMGWSAPENTVLEAFAVKFIKCVYEDGDAEALRAMFDPAALTNATTAALISNTPLGQYTEMSGNDLIALLNSTVMSRRIHGKVDVAAVAGGCSEVAIVATAALVLKPFGPPPSTAAPASASSNASPPPMPQTQGISRSSTTLRVSKGGLVVGVQIVAEDAFVESS